MILRLWLLVVLTLAGAFAPSRACAHVAETRAQDFFATTTETRPETAPQVADSHQGNLGHGYELASGYSQAAESETTLLQGHLNNAIARFEAEGYTAEQAASLAENPGLAGAHRGTQIDTFFKDSVSLDPQLSHLELTPRYKFGPDVFNPANQTWWDVTTPAQWQGHVEKYWLFGDGTPLLTK